MNSAPLPQERGNPFIADRIRPGAIDFIFPADVTKQQLLDKLRANHWRGAIIGAHGSGKSTLLQALRPALEAAGRQVASFELHDGERRLPTSLRGAGAMPGGIVVVDGYEQLSWLSKVRLLWGCQWTGCGLLVTAHQPVTLPTLWETQTSQELALEVVRQLAGTGQAAAVLSADEVSRAFASHEGNIREMLFGLYDLYRQRQANGGH